MAKFSKNAAFLLLAVFAFVAHAHVHSGDGGAVVAKVASSGGSGGKGDASGGSSGGDAAGGASGGSEGGAGKLGELLNKGGLGSLMNGGGSKGGDGVDPATKFKSVLNKFLLVLQSYTSKELGPELKNAAIKLIQFVLHYWAQQKPGEMQKFNKFLETSAKATSGALSKASSGSGSSGSDGGSSSGGSSGGASGQSQA